MDVRTHFKALWVEFSAIVLEDCRLYFAPWMRMRRIRNAYENK